MRNTSNGSNNVALGFSAGRSSNGTGNIFLGNQAGEFAGNVSNQLFIDNSSTSSPLIGGDFSTDELNLNAKVNIRDAMHINPRATAPAGGVKGDLYMDTDGFLYIHNGTAWKQIVVL